MSQSALGGDRPVQMPMRRTAWLPSPASSTLGFPNLPGLLDEGGIAFLMDENNGILLEE